MKTQVNLHKISLFFKENISLIGVLVTLPILGGVLLYSINNYYQKDQDLIQLKDEVTALDQQVNVLKSDKDLVEDDVDDFNQVLTQLIPETEDYFSIIAALEQLSQSSGFVITGYEINLADTNAQKIALTVNGTGDAESFIKFLQSYQFEGGRLITNEKIEFTPDAVGTIRLNLNFYNKKTQSSEGKLSRIAQKDVELMQQIRDKISFVFKTDQPVQAYPTKDNPF